MLEDPASPPVPSRLGALFAFLEKVNGSSPAIRREDVEAVKAAGWSDEAIYDAVTVCSLFNFYNRWCDATGVADMPPEAYAEAGRRVAATGYIPPEE